MTILRDNGCIAAEVHMTIAGQAARKRWLFYSLGMILVLLANLAGLALLEPAQMLPGAQAAPLAQVSNDPFKVCEILDGLVMDLDLLSETMCTGQASDMASWNLWVTSGIVETSEEARISAGADQSNVILYAVGDFGGEIYEAAGSDDVYVGDYELRFSRGCYWVAMSGYQEDSPDGVLVAAAHNLATQIDTKINGLSDTCPDLSLDLGGGGPGPAAPTATPSPTPTATPASVDFYITGLGCSGDPMQTGFPGWVTCTPSLVGEPFDDPASFTWEMDGQPVPGTSRTLDLEEVPTGEHTVRVTATLHGVSKSFTGYVTVIDGANPPAFKLSMSCRITPAASGRDIECSAAPLDARTYTADKMTFEWYWDGAKVSNCSTFMCFRQGAAARQMTVQVKATDLASGEVSPWATYVIPAPANAQAPAPVAGQVQVTSPGGAAVITPGQQTGASLSQGQKAAARLKCRQLMDALELMNLVYDVSTKAIIAQILGGSGNAKLSTSEALIMAVIIKCGKLLSAPASPGALVGVGGWRPPLAAETAAQFSVEVRQGALRFEVAHDQAAVEVRAGTTVVSAAGKSSFGVGYEPQSGVTVVAAYRGAVDVQPQNGAFQPVRLQTGQMVQVTGDSVGAVESIPASAGGGAAQVWPWAAGLCCLGLVGVGGLAGLIGGGIWLGRRTQKPRQQMAPPQSANCPPAAARQPGAPPPGYPLPPPPRSAPQAQPASYPPMQAPRPARLVVVQGASRQAVNLTVAGLMIGRGEDCGLRLSDARVSRQHAQVQLNAGRWYIRDLSSGNGTFVNGAKVQQRVLNPGDRIQIGDTLMVFQSK
jgi:hypothetical protein